MNPDLSNWLDELYGPPEYEGRPVRTVEPPLTELMSAAEQKSILRAALAARDGAHDEAERHREAGGYDGLPDRHSIDGERRR